MTTKRKRPQAQKVNRHANPVMAAAMRELRKSSAAQPHRNKVKYYRPAEKRGDWS